MKLETIHQAILNSMSETVYVIDRDMKIKYANPAAESLTGFNSGDALGKYCHDVFCERSDYCLDKCPPKRAMIQGVPILHREAETRNRSGELRQTQISISPLYEEQICVGAVIVIKDISDLKEAEEKIKHQNQFLSSVIDALPHPFYVIDAATYQVKLANYAAYRGDLPAGTTCFSLSHKRSDPCRGDDHPCPFTKVIDTGLPVTMEHRHHDGNGVISDVEVHGFPIFDDKGRVVQVIEYCIDISDRKRAVEEREQLIKELQSALREVRMLSGLLPICSSCKRIKNEQGAWSNLEMYISDHSGAQFTHGICPDCAQRLYPDYYKKGSNE
ncbi:MAG: PAS domain-containing protein [Nitrospirota bacterium]|nr:PAS domain-containing protein [Nitrospirota bacterium]